MRRAMPGASQGGRYVSVPGGYGTVPVQVALPDAATWRRGPGRWRRSGTLQMALPGVATRKPAVAASGAHGCGHLGAARLIAPGTSAAPGASAPASPSGADRNRHLQSPSTHQAPATPHPPKKKKTGRSPRAVNPRREYGAPAPPRSTTRSAPRPTTAGAAARSCRCA